MANEKLFDEVSQVTLRYLESDPQYQKWLEWWREGDRSVRGVGEERKGGTND